MLDAFPSGAGEAGMGIAIAAGTLVQEDLAVAGAAWLAAMGRISWTGAFLSCFAGIWIGDALLYLAARRMGRPRLASPWLARLFNAGSLARAEGWFREHGAWMLVACRVLPGTRLPTFLAAGVLGWPMPSFLWITGLTAAAWTVLLVFGARHAAHLLPAPAAAGGLASWIVPAVLAAALAALRLPWRRLHRALGTTLGRWRRWEFWPAWLFYLPVAVQYVRLSARHGGLHVPAAANPGLEFGGLVGESKHRILADLHAASPAFVAEAWLVRPGPHDERCADLESLVARHQVSFPFVLKPDVGQRGAGVKVIRDAGSARRHLADNPAALVLQRHVEGPHEVGIFYHRQPGEERGRIFAVTEKVFPHVTGDGRRTLGELVADDPRARFMEARYRARFAGRWNEVIAPGEGFRLVHAGNHAQGCLFLDGARLITPRLEARIDAISRSLPGFHVGRYDIRYARPEDLAAGAGFKILELNGAGAEATSIYDPANSLLGAYRTLFRQWEIVFQAGAENIRRGFHPPGVRALVSAWREGRRSLRGAPIAD